jgi:O-antigen/teichoic acid export membrane protein
MNRLRALPGPLRAALLYALALGWAKGLSLLLLPLITAQLAPADFARLELLASAGEIAALLAGAGLVDTLYRFGAPMAGRVLGLAVGIAGLGLAAALLVAPLGALLPLAAAREEVALLGIAVALEAAIGVPLAWLRMQGRALAWSVTMALRGTAQAGLAAVLLLSGHGVAGVLAAGAVATAITALLLVRMQARETGLRLDPGAWRRLLAYGLPLTGGGLAAFCLGTADRWFLAGAVAPEALAHYALAAKISLVAALLTQPFELWWYPRRIEVLEGSDGAARSARMVGFGAALVLLAAAAVALGGPVLITLATPAAYHGALAWLPWLCAAVALQSLGSLVNVGCYMGRTGAQPLAVNGAAAAVALVLYVALIPPFGVAGAIAATLAAQAVRLGAFLWLSQRRRPVAYPLGRIGLFGVGLALAAALPPAGALAALAAAPLVALRLGLLPRWRHG